jgi:hypothetical protein
MSLELTKNSLSFTSMLFSYHFIYVGPVFLLQFFYLLVVSNLNSVLDRPNQLIYKLFILKQAEVSALLPRCGCCPCQYHKV